MNDLTQGLAEAVYRVATLDPELIEITLRSLQVTVTAVVIAAAIALPMGLGLRSRGFARGGM